MRFLALIACGGLILAGCSGETKTEDSAPQREPAASSTPNESPNSVTGGASANPPAGSQEGHDHGHVTATVTEAQLRTLMTALMAQSSHGEVNPSELKSMLDSMTSIEKGKPQSGNLHLHHEGKHLNVMLTIDRTGDDAYALTFHAEDPGVEQMLQKQVQTATKK
ncbi:MAG TPA: hypothetical protein VM328_07665 [Fimbriimonadaceae bacterium]|nr:hypothetical protein [Fimbriimonadaceae bacterium]